MVWDLTDAAGSAGTYTVTATYPSEGSTYAQLTLIETSPRTFYQSGIATVPSSDSSITATAENTNATDFEVGAVSVTNGSGEALTSAAGWTDIQNNSPTAYPAAVSYRNASELETRRIRQASTPHPRCARRWRAMRHHPLCSLVKSGCS
jgi:hypothetical protein